MNDRNPNPYSHWLNSELNAQVQQEFLHIFKHILSNKDEISPAVFERASMRLNGKVMGLTDFEKLKYQMPSLIEKEIKEEAEHTEKTNAQSTLTLNAFKEDGELNTTGLTFSKIKYSIDYNRVASSSLQQNGFRISNPLCFRERLIIDAAHFAAKAKVTDAFLTAITRLTLKQVELSQEMNTKKLTKARKNDLLEQSSRYEEEMVLVKDFFNHSIELICKRIEGLGLKNPLGYEMNNQMKNSIDDLLAELAWKSLFNRATKIRKVYEKIEIEREFSSKKFEKETRNIVVYATALNDLNLTNLQKLTNLVVTLREGFDMQAQDPTLMLSKKKAFPTYADFVKHLNDNPHKHHFARMLGFVLKNLYEDPSIPQAALPLDDKNELQQALSSLEFPKEAYYADLYNILLPIDISMIGTEPKEEGKNNNNNITSLISQFRQAKFF